jgi:hypothetical protein
MDLDQYRLQNMTPTERSMFASETAKREKTVFVGYLAWLLIGFHYAYVGRWAAQILFWLTGGGLLVWWLVDLFRIPSIVEQHNLEVRDSVALSLTSLRGLGAAGGPTSQAIGVEAEGLTAQGSRSEDSPSTVMQLVLPFVGLGALAGFAITALGYSRFQQWRISPGSGTRLCDCMQLTQMTAGDLITAEGMGAGIGAVVGAIGLVPVFERTRRRSRLLKLQSQ